jgi:hypothetical protein
MVANSDKDITEVDFTKPRLISTMNTLSADECSDACTDEYTCMFATWYVGSNCSRALDPYTV